MSTPFPYAARARDVEGAHSAVASSLREVKRRSNPKDPATARWIANVDKFHAALAAAYPQNFWSDLDDLRAGNAQHIETALAFLEADPIFFRSGYTKTAVLRAIKRLPLTSSDRDRLRAVVVHLITTRDGSEFRQYCRLARRLDGAGFRETLAQLAASDTPAVARRAQWVLAALDQKPTA
jgi:hypothetical protein